ncbi:MAG: hypothetical protein A3D94_20370 [Alphaproteobacteria bacterium RIFCSPHIGHO2_12_FULL_66_14]|nr:MAG: hypothetical protein A3D94_20370 [Alphaproteobacteria bacterium RIFCSPHIGHO2_12_FULL_66_14]
MPPFQVPLTIGVTGHRQIAGNCTEAIEAAVASILDGVRAKAPHAPLLLLTGLAEGADRLVARLASQRFGAELVVVLPRAAESYRSDFATAESQEEFDRLLKSARLVVTCPEDNAEATAGYLWAGNFTALHSHLLIALWDGDAARGDGGTAEIVRAKLKGRYAGWDEGEPLRYDEGGAVAHVITARAGEKAPDGVGRIDWLYPDAVLIGARGGEHRHAAVLSAFNMLNGLLTHDGRARDAWRAGPAAPNVDALKMAADHLASQFQRRTVIAVRLMVLATFVAALASALQGAISPIVTAAALATGLAVWITSTRSRWQRLHADLRALAEAGRIQTAWIASGLPLCIADHYHPAQATSVAWIRRAIRTAFLLDDIQRPREAPSPEDRKRHAEAGHAWIDEQVAYFLGNRGVVPRYRRQARHFAILGLVCLGIGLLIVAGNKLLDVAHIEQTVLDTALLLQVGRIALAITASVSAYQAFMSFGDLQRSFAVSAHLFSLARDEAKAAAAADDYPRLIRLIVQLGRAALVENVSWVILRRQRRIKPPAA